MKIFYVDTGVNKGYLYYNDLYRSLCKIADVSLFLSGSFKIGNIVSLARSFDVIIFGLGWMAQNDASVYGKIVGLRKFGVPVVVLLHKPQTLLSNKLKFCRDNADLLVYAQVESEEYGRVANVPFLWSWHAGDHKVFFDRGAKKVFDFGFSGALHGSGKTKGATRDIRVRIFDIVRSMGIRLFWNGSDKIAPRIRSVGEYALRINQSKIWLTTTGPLEDVGPRYFEIGLSRSLIFCNRMGRAYNNVFRDGDNCVMFENDLSDFREKLLYYLGNDGERLKIVDRAFNEFRLKHTWDCRARELVDRIGVISRG